MTENLKASYRMIGENHFCSIIKSDHVKFVCHIGFICPEDAISWADDEIIRSKACGYLADIWHPLKPTQYAQGH